MLPTIFSRKNYATPSVVDDFLSNGIFSPMFGFEQSWNSSRVPAVNVEEKEKEYIIDVAAPGLDKKDFKVSLDENVLTISSSREESAENKKEGVILREFSYSSFSRAFTLPQDVDSKKIQASHKNGVLTINIPKSEAKEKALKEIKIN